MVLAARVVPDVHRLASLARDLRPRSKSFPLPCNSYKAGKTCVLYFYALADGLWLALYENRRSGAQRGASENNFGQRFSVSTPCLSPNRLVGASP
jgi:hypothetical protein